MSLRLVFEPVTQEFILGLESEFIPRPHCNSRRSCSTTTTTRRSSAS